MDTLKQAAEALTNEAVQTQTTTEQGIIISILGYVVVFASLVTLLLIVTGFSNLLKKSTRKKLAAKGEFADAKSGDLDIPGDTIAAISMALHLHFAEIHDIENTIITIKKVQRPYSPWSSKIYGLRQYPTRK